MEPNCEENGCEYISEIMKAIKAWDEFVTPIREFYGVPQYKPKGDNRNELCKNQTR